jgi:hypothetical protein
MNDGKSGKENSPQTRHRAKQIEEESRGKRRITEDSYFVAKRVYLAILFP